jgi:hypothetical protein
MPPRLVVDRVVPARSLVVEDVFDVRVSGLGVNCCVAVRVGVRRLESDRPF